MMNYDEFQKYFLEHVLEYMPEKYRGCRIEMHEVLKINGPRLHGVCLKLENSPVAPIVYLEKLHEEQLHGNSVDTILKKFALEYVSENEKLSARIGIGAFVSTANRENITYQLINRSQNRELLRESPHMCVLDLAKVYYVQVGDSERARITYDLMDAWGMSLQELDAAAMANVNEYMRPRLFAIGLDQIAEDKGAGERYFSSAHLKENEMYCLSNKRLHLGAGAILAPGVLQELGEKFGEDFYIIPSSTHEMMLVKKGGAMDAKDLQEVLHSANRDTVLPEDYLGDQVYEFQREKDRIVISPELQKSEKER